MTQGRTLAGKPKEMIVRALSIDAHHKKALALAASAELHENHIDASLGYWQRLAAEYPAESDEAKQLVLVMDQIKSGAGKTAGSAVPSNAAPAAPAKSAAVSGKVALAAA